MRYAARTVAAAVVSAGATVAVALLSAGHLADAPTRGRLSGPDPLASVASLAALAIGVVAFIWLGGSIARDAARPRPAIVAGAIGGALTGLVGGLAQSAALSDYLAAVLVGYAVPAEFLTIALGTYVVIATVSAALVGGAICYAGWYRGRTTTATR